MYVLHSIFTNKPERLINTSDTLNSDGHNLVVWVSSLKKSLMKGKRSQSVHSRDPESAVCIDITV